MIIRRVTVGADEITLHVCPDKHENEPDLSQADLDTAVASGQMPRLAPENADVAAQFQTAMTAGKDMQLMICAAPEGEPDLRPDPEAETAAPALESASLYGDGYFDSYESLEVHQVMLKDRPRMEAYAEAIKRANLQGKAVLDVGCGTGILSMMAARAGARVVYAVEASSFAKVAARAVKENGLDHIVKVLHSPVEQVELGEQVDVLVSEWMGFYLVHESMLGSVLAARDRFLAPGGAMLPALAAIHVAPVSMDAVRRDKVDFWGDVDGFDFSFLREPATRELVATPQVEVIEESQLLSAPQLFAEIDCRTVTPRDLERMESELHFTFNRSGHLAGFCAWFDCTFPSISAEGGSEPATSTYYNEYLLPRDPSKVVLCTAPSSVPTHWKQTVFMLGRFVPVNAGEKVGCHIDMTQDGGNPRHYVVSVSTDVDADSGAAGAVAME